MKTCLMWERKQPSTSKKHKESQSRSTKDVHTNSWQKLKKRGNPESSRGQANSYISVRLWAKFSAEILHTRRVVQYFKVIKGKVTNKNI